MIASKKLLIVSFFLFLLKNSYSEEYYYEYKYKELIKEDYLALLNSNKNFLNSTLTFCNEKKSSLNTLKNKYIDLLKYWTSVQHIRFGPIEDFNNYMRIQFWPDKRGVIQRQFNKVISQKLKEYTEFIDLGQKSVAIQGIPALERIIYEELDRKQNTESPFLCNYMISISKNLDTIFNYTYNIWKNDAIFFEYTDRKDLLNLFYSSVLSQLELIINHKLTYFNEYNKKYDLKKLEFSRSAYSLNSIQNNLSSIYKFYEVVINPLLEASKYSRVEEFDKEIKKAILSLKKIVGPIEHAENNEQMIRDIKNAQIQIKQIYEKLLINISSHLSINIGFNKLDGD